MWNPGTGACVAVLDGHTRAVTSIAYGPGDMLASCAWDGTIRIWDTAAKECTQVLTGHEGNV